MGDQTADSLLAAASRQLRENEEWQTGYRAYIRRPANPALSDSARAVLQRLYDLQGRGILTGQHDYFESPDEWNNKIMALTGQYPAVHGYELGAIGGQSDAEVSKQYGSIVWSATNSHKAGALVTMSWHAVLPGLSYEWENAHRSLLQEEFDKYVTSGTSENTALITEIDKVAVPLKALRDAGVPVLWRPYHEDNGDWWWWGCKSNFAEIWELLFDRLTNHHELNNLIWVWAPNANNQWSDDAVDFYPGHNRVDVLGMSLYNGDYAQEYYQALLRIGQGKLIAITECDKLPDLDKIRTRMPLYSFFMAWGKLVKEANTDAVIKAAYSNPYAVNRDQAEKATIALAATIDNSTGDGLAGRYYVGRDFGKLALSKVVPQIDFTWAKSTPVGSWEMSAVWSGYLRPQASGDHTLIVKTTGGVRLYLDGEPVIDNWLGGPAAEFSAAVKLEAGRYYALKLEYFNTSNPAGVQLAWEQPGRVREVIRQEHLYSE